MRREPGLGTTRRSRDKTPTASSAAGGAGRRAPPRGGEAMDARAQLVMVFHLDKCIGCHTCSISCKNIWTDRRGAEYMWWNNVETKPGVGYPKRWEDQEIFN